MNKSNYKDIKYLCISIIIYLFFTILLQAYNTYHEVLKNKAIKETEEYKENYYISGDYFHSQVGEYFQYSKPQK